MNAYDLPTSLKIGEVEYAIRYNWRAIMDILVACNDPLLDEYSRMTVILQIFYPEWNKIPQSNHEEALRKACDFIDCGQKDNGRPKPKMIDWEQDASIIIPEINKAAGHEVRLNPDIHWWTFFGWFMEIGDGLFASVLHIRKKRAQHKKLDKWEQEFYDANRSLIDMKTAETDEIKEEKANILKWLK